MLARSSARVASEADPGATSHLLENLEEVLLGVLGLAQAGLGLSGQVWALPPAPAGLDVYRVDTGTRET